MPASRFAEIAVEHEYEWGGAVFQSLIQRAAFAKVAFEANHLVRARLAGKRGSVIRAVVVNDDDARDSREL